MYVAGENSRLPYLLSPLGTFPENTSLAATSEVGGRLLSLAIHPGGEGGGTLEISGWGCVLGTLEPLTYTRASSAEFC